MIKSKEQLKRTATTKIVKNQNKYTLPEYLNVEVYNKKTKRWRRPNHYITLTINDTKKTDETLKIIY